MLLVLFVEISFLVCFFFCVATEFKAIHACSTWQNSAVFLSYIFITTLVLILPSGFISAVAHFWCWSQDGHLKLKVFRRQF